MEAELHELKLKQAEDQAKKLKKSDFSSESKGEVIPPSISEEIDERLSTHNINSKFKRFQGQLNNWLHLKF